MGKRKRLDPGMGFLTRACAEVAPDFFLFKEEFSWSVVKAVEVSLFKDGLWFDGKSFQILFRS